MMDDSPYQFITQHEEKDSARFLSFRHRTFKPDDVIFLVEVLQDYYREHKSLEDAFASLMTGAD